MSREEGRSEEKELLLLLLYVQNISLITTGKALRAPDPEKKIRPLSDFVGLNSEVFVL